MIKKLFINFYFCKQVGDCILAKMIYILYRHEITKELKTIMMPVMPKLGPFAHQGKTRLSLHESVSLKKLSQDTIPTKVT